MSPHASLPDRLGYLLEHIAAMLNRQIDQAIQEQLGVGLSQLKIMAMLQDYPETTQRRLADGLGQTEASISRQVKLLAGKGWAAVKVDPAERRRRLVVLTPRGAKLGEVARQLLEQKRAQLFGTLSKKEKEQLQRTFETLHDFTCKSGKTRACDRPFDLLDVYTQQRQ